MVRVELSRGEGLWVAGPARVEVASGSLLASGYTIESGCEVVVRGARGFTFYAVGERASVEVTVGQGGGYAIVREGWDVVESWMKLLDVLEGRAARRVVIVGPVESGKSTFAVWVRNRLGLCTVEADIGQNELGMPGFVSFARPGEGRVLSLQDLSADGGFFVGHISADRAADLVVSAAARASRACGSFVLDTDGYVSSRGVLYKAALVEAVDADYVVAMDEHVARQLRGLRAEVLVAKRPKLVRERERLDRRVFRQRLYASLFSNTQTLVLQGTPVLSLCSYTVEGDVVVYSCDGVRIVEARRRPSAEGYWLRPGWARGLLAAVSVGDYELPALVEQFDPRTGKTVVRVPSRFNVEAKAVRSVRLGWVRLSENYVEDVLPVLPHPLAVVRAASGASRQRLERRPQGRV
jgi:polynucleotide 5'-hydroxyl-kinase GRC3/NOL9